VLVPIYENYGFRRIEDDSDVKHIYMKKKIRRDYRYADFPFGGVEDGESPTMSNRFTRSRRESRKSGNTRSRRRE